MSETLPVNLDAERLILGSILLDDALFGQVSGAVNADDFSLERHRRIFLRMADLHNRGERIDRVTVAEELQRQGQLESVDGLTYLVSLDDGLPKIENLESYVRIVQDKAALRRVIYAARDIARRAQDSARPEELADSLSALAGGIRPAGVVRRPISAEGLLAEVSLEGLLAPSRERGLRLPWPGLDNLLCGLQPEQLVLVAGHTSSGKTSLALQIAAQAVIETGVIYFSLEMGPGRLFRRMAVQRARVNHDLLRHGALEAEDRRKVQAAAAWITEHPIWFDERATTVPAIVAGIRRVRLEQVVGLVVVDYLQLLSGVGRHDSRAQEVGGLTRALKLAAQEFHLPVVLLSQFRRPEVGGKPRNPGLHDLKESGDIENHADIVLLIRPDLDQPRDADPVRVNIHVAKQREGPRNRDVAMLFRGWCQRFEEATEVPEENQSEVA
ncbi:MAG: DnaB-like helicase C-terminal domain-containing protein [Acidobacteriota bacterium]